MQCGQMEMRVKFRLASCVFYETQVRKADSVTGMFSWQKVGKMGRREVWKAMLGTDKLHCILTHILS